MAKAKLTAKDKLIRSNQTKLRNKKRKVELLKRNYVEELTGLKRNHAEELARLHAEIRDHHEILDALGAKPA